MLHVLAGTVDPYLSGQIQSVRHGLHILLFRCGCIFSQATEFGPHRVHLSLFKDQKEPGKP